MNESTFHQKKPQITSDEDFVESVNSDDIRRERGVKHDFSKPQYSLLPLIDLEGVVRVLEFGAKKYARGDWKFVDQGGTRYLDAGLRHLAEVIEGPLSTDPESGLFHIDHAITSLIFARYFVMKEASTK